MKELSRRELMIMSEGNPFTTFVGNTMGIATNAAKKVAGVAGRTAKEVGKAFVPYDTMDFAKKVKNKIWDSPGGKQAKQRQKLVKNPQIQEAITRTDKKINRMMATKKVRPTAITNMPTLASGKASSKFAMIEPEGRIVYIFYPFSKRGRPNSDTGFFVWDGIGKRVVTIERPLRRTKFVKQPTFVTLQNLVGGDALGQTAANRRPRQKKRT